jgi:dihydroorotase-like cyclic amidohydrolase
MPDTLPPEFTRLSPALLDLREREHHMIGCRRFEEAANLHREFERRQAQELRERRREYFVHRERTREQVERRGERRERAAIANWDRKVARAKLSMESELAPLRGGCANFGAKVGAARAEYVGEDDPILRQDPTLADARESGNMFRVGARHS